MIHQVITETCIEYLRITFLSKDPAIGRHIEIETQTCVTSFLRPSCLRVGIFVLKLIVNSFQTFIV